MRCFRGPAGSASRRAAWGRGARLVCVALAALLSVLSAVLVTTSSVAQAAEEEVRIVARRLDDGRVESALQQRQADDSWGDRQLPRARLFPTDATTGHWLVSSPLTLTVSGTEEEVRIVARRLDDGRVEFALQQRQADDSWGDRQLPRARLFPTDATIGHWLVSSPVSLDNTDSPGDGSSGSGPNDDSNSPDDGSSGSDPNDGDTNENDDGSDSNNDDGSSGDDSTNNDDSNSDDDGSSGSDPNDGDTNENDDGSDSNNDDGSSGGGPTNNDDSNSDDPNGDDGSTNNDDTNNNDDSNSDDPNGGNPGGEQDPPVPQPQNSEFVPPPPEDEEAPPIPQQQNNDPPDCSDAPDGATCNSNEEGTAWFFSPGPWD